MVRCPKCDQEMVVYEATDIMTYEHYEQFRCHKCGYWYEMDSDDPFKISKSNYFTLSFGTCGGDKDVFKGTKEDIHKQIDAYEWVGFQGSPKEERLRQIATIIDILKHGYQNEFVDNDYREYRMNVDNALDFEIRYGIGRGY